MIDLSGQRPDHPAVIQDGVVWTYAELERRSLRIARNLADLGLEPGDRVATLLPNCHELLALYLACFQAGFTIVPLDMRYHSAQVNFALRHSEASVIVTTPDRMEDVDRCEAIHEIDHVYVTGNDNPQKHTPFRNLLQKRPRGELFGELRGDDIGIVFYTSGTTARPKGVTLIRDAVTSSIRKASAVLRLNENDVALIAAPIARPMALRTQLLTTLAAGGTVVLLNRFDPNLYLRTLNSEPKSTFLALLPSGLRQILFHRDMNPSSLAEVRLCVCGGDHVPADLFERFHNLTGLELTEQCGMTETGMYAINPPYGRKKRRSIGLPYYGAQVTIIDRQGNDVPWGESGEIAVHSPFAMDGYWNDTAATRRVIRDGWIRTGDIGCFDDDGYLWMQGRKKDIIVCRGSNISPAAVEAVLQQHEGVNDACVVGVEDEEAGQAVSAFVTLTDNRFIATIEADLIELAKQELAEYMIPESICVLPRLPATGSGKVDRQRLKWIAESSDEETLGILLG